ncbi:MAG: sugar phosphate isomerase/epimerase [Planctomycetota bacterium]|nr:sugar phosphate isomerase/epimerase [Planctomycetota bacterium]
MIEKCLIGIRDDTLGASWQEAFADAKSVGAECLELDVPATWRDYPIYSTSGRKKLKELEAASGVKLVSICLGAFWKLSPSCPDANVRGQAEALLAETMLACDAYGVPHILVPFTDWKGEPPLHYNDQKQGWVKVLTSLKDRIGKAKTKVGFELCARDFAHSVQHGLEILAASNTPAGAGIYYDTANGSGRGHLAEQDIPKLAGTKRLAAVHIKDTGGSHLGEGKVNWPEVKKALEAAQYAGPFVLETPGGDDMMASAKKNLDFAKKLFRG